MTDEREIKKYICSNCGEMTDFPMPKILSGNGNCAIITCLILIGLIALFINPIVSVILFIVALFIPFMIKKEVIYVCPFCENESLFLVDSPKGKKVFAEYYNQSDDNI